MARTVTHQKGDPGVKNSARAEGLQRERFGGLNLGAAFFGWLVAMGMEVILIALLAAAGSAVALTTLNDVNLNAVNGEDAQTIGLVSGALLLIVVSLAYYAGGYVAGRMSRFDGARQGFGAWLIGVLVIILLGAAGATLGAKYNIFQGLNLPALPTDTSKFTDGGIITMILTLVLTLLAAIGGGKAGERYHRKVDEAAVVD